MVSVSNVWWKNRGWSWLKAKLSYFHLAIDTNTSLQAIWSFKYGRLYGVFVSIPAALHIRLLQVTRNPRNQKRNGKYKTIPILGCIVLYDNNVSCYGGKRHTFGLKCLYKVVFWTKHVFSTYKWNGLNICGTNAHLYDINATTSNRSHANGSKTTIANKLSLILAYSNTQLQEFTSHHGRFIYIIIWRNDLVGFGKNKFAHWSKRSNQI